MSSLKKILTKDFFIGNLGNNEVTEKIIKVYSLATNSRLEEHSEYDIVASTGLKNKPIFSKEIRKCHVSWLNVSKENFIENGLRKLLENINETSWNLSLKHEWESDIQFTKYIGKGEHYDWHRDYYPKTHTSKRVLSIVYCLSHKSEYEGGQFQIKQSDGSTYSIKFDYGDFIVFPSVKLHRVVPLKSGTRITMVGWYR